MRNMPGVQTLSREVAASVDVALHTLATLSGAAVLCLSMQMFLIPFDMAPRFGVKNGYFEMHLVAGLTFMTWLAIETRQLLGAWFWGLPLSCLSAYSARAESMAETFDVIIRTLALVWFLIALPIWRGRP